MRIELENVQNLLEWIKIKLYLNTKVEEASKRIVKRGEVYNCYFGIGVGSEIQKMRPCVILQNDIANLRSGNVLVAPISHTYKNIPSIKPITKQYNKDNSILIDGYVNTSNIICVSKARLKKYITTLTKEEMKEIDKAIAVSLNLMKYYVKIRKNLEDKMLFIQKVKTERNIAQDKIETLLRITKSRNYEELENFLKSIDIK